LRFESIQKAELFLRDLKEGNLGEYKGVGIYWTWEREWAYSYSNTLDEISVVLKAIISKKEINWEETIKQNTLNDSYREKKEKEITLKEGSRVEIVDIFLEGESVLKAGKTIHSIAYISSQKETTLVTLEGGRLFSRTFKIEKGGS